MATKDEIITAELTDDPLVRGYSGMANAEAKRDDGNITYRTLAQGVFLSDAYQYLSHRNNDPGTGQPQPILVQLEELADLGTVQGVTATSTDQIAAKNLMGFFDKATDAGGLLIFMDFSQAAIRLSWDAMVAVGVLSQSQLDTLKLLSDVPISRWAELGVSPVSTQDIIDAGG